MRQGRARGFHLLRRGSGRSRVYSTVVGVTADRQQAVPVTERRLKEQRRAVVTAEGGGIGAFFSPEHFYRGREPPQPKS